jgi:hypothetical protein
MPLKEVLNCSGFGRNEVVEEDGEVTEMLNIVFPRSLLVSLSYEQQMYE